MKSEALAVCLTTIRKFDTDITIMADKNMDYVNRAGHFSLYDPIIRFRGFTINNVINGCVPKLTAILLSFSSN